jgi:hypothetical protein
MEQQLKERKKYSKLDEEAWQKVRIFVNDYFQQREEAVKATYEILFREISQKYPHIELGKGTFKKKVGSIEALKSSAGILIPTQHLSKDHCSQLKDKFLRVLVGLPLPEFESIRFRQLVDRAHQSDPDLKINEINQSTLAFRFSLKALKALARGLRDAATASHVHGSVSFPEAQAPKALGTLAAETPESILRVLPRKRRHDEFEPYGDFEAEDSGPRLTPQFANPAQRPQPEDRTVQDQEPPDPQAESSDGQDNEYGMCIRVLF